MRVKLFLIYIITILFSFYSCQKNKIKYELYSNGKLAFVILPKDIEFYDTTQSRNGIEIHELRLEKSFYKKDSLKLVYPMYLNCVINEEKYFWSDFFHSHQSQSRLWINFHFRSSCENWWTFPEPPNRKSRLQDLDTLILHTINDCNSIEFFHEKKHMKDVISEYYIKQEYFRNYTDTARLAHEILYDPYYINSLKESGINVR